MLTNLLLSLAILLVSLVNICHAFAPLPTGVTNLRAAQLAMAESDDPTKTWYAVFADGIQDILTNSPLNDAKKALVKSLAGDYDEEATKEKLMSLIDDNPVLMLSFVTCPFCIKAKGIMNSLGAKYTVVELDQVTDGKAIRAVMASVVGRTSVPAIWIGGTFIGGCNDGPMGGVASLNDSGQLKDLLAGVGAL
ncbi:protein disulfide oxidoreductase [Fragilaria crotonensis]|nr:protein disulfide oxidoreductase [Fragilaria crotonensis]